MFRSLPLLLRLGGSRFQPFNDDARSLPASRLPGPVLRIAADAFSVPGPGGLSSSTRTRSAVAKAFWRMSVPRPGNFHVRVVCANRERLMAHLPGLDGWNELARSR